jgi:hypothetical protein
MTRKTRNPESGYVLLYVFSMSAIIAIGLYEQLPRAAFEAQREKEALLIMHGEQYKRGVQLYVRKMGRYPAKMEDLDNTQNIRFLRKHYIDPMTGKEEWRLLHMGPNGKLIDSKIKTQDPNASQWHQGSITEFKSAETSDDGSPMNANIATRKRPSDDQVQLPMQGGMGPGGAPDPSLVAGVAPGGAGPGGAPAAPTDPNAPPKAPGWLAGGALPGMPPGQRGVTLPQAPNVPVGNQNGNSASTANQSSVSGNGGYGTPSNNGGFSNAPQTPVTPGGAVGPGGGVGPNGQQYATQPGSNQNNPNGFGQPGAQTSATSMINNLLTQPRPGGAPAGVGGPAIGGTVMGGLAGVASTYKGHGIKRYNDQDEYSKWEFFYDLGAEQAAAAQSQANQMNTGSQPNQANQAGQAGFGGQGNQGGFGGPPSQQTQSNQANGITTGNQATQNGFGSPRTQ